MAVYRYRYQAIDPRRLARIVPMNPQIVDVAPLTTCDVQVDSRAKSDLDEAMAAWGWVFEQVISP